MQLKISYEVAQHIYGRWCAAGPEWHLTPGDLELLRARLSWPDERPTVLGFLRAVDDAIDRAIEQFTTGIRDEHTSG